MMDSVDCIECDCQVRARQEGLQCDGCDRWQHRTCNTGISQRIYKATVRGEPEGLQTWYCNYCPRPGMGPATPTVRQEPATPTVRQEPATPTVRQEPATPTVRQEPATPILRKGPATPTVRQEPVPPTLAEGPALPTLIKKPARSPRREVLDSSQLERSPIRARRCPMEIEISSSSSSDESDETEVERAPVFRPLFLPLCPRKFRWNPRVPAPDATFIVEHKDDVHMADDRSPRRMDKAFLEDDSEDSEDDTFWFPSMRSTNLFFDEETRYEIIENGTSFGHRKLVSSDGYSYTVKRSSARTTTWKCSVRNRKVQCSASVIQRGQSFTRGLNDHIHSGIPCLAKRLKVMSKVKTRAMTDRHLSAGNIVKAVLREEPNTCGLPRSMAENLISIVKRQRSKLSLQH
ncbi:uncharacterized protein LOC110440548 [Mizuhopecten yessoensis]|uniref:uncharacterized protein LOC110440548 n=1 Tax=Mizuhopecten yessoensis TaxID=6573 RepID=UPI000B45E96D|nr:uncharacterized protein LOC110440548 [Mizuhopecten yessoensis]